MAILSCDSAASVPCGTRGATRPPPATSAMRVNRAVPAAEVLLVVVAAVAAAFRAAEAGVAGQQNL